MKPDASRTINQITVRHQSQVIKCTILLIPLLNRNMELNTDKVPVSDFCPINQSCTQRPSQPNRSFRAVQCHAPPTNNQDSQRARRMKVPSPLTCQPRRHSACQKFHEDKIHSDASRNPENSEQSSSSQEDKAVTSYVPQNVTGPNKESISLPTFTRGQNPQ